MTARRALFVLALLPLALARPAEAWWEAPFPYFAIGSYGSAPGQFDRPFGITADPNGLIYVTDEGNGRIEVFSPNGYCLREFGGEIPLSSPTGIVVHPNGDVYVAEHHVWRISRFTAGGSLVGTFADPDLVYPVGIAVDADGNLLVASSEAHSIVKFAPDGTKLAVLPSPPSPALVQPYGVAVGPAGEIYVSDPGAQRVAVLDAAGNLLRTFGEPGSGPGQFSGPNQLHFGPGGLLYVTDGGGDRIQVFHPDGTFVGEWGGPEGSDLGQFSVAVDVVFVVYQFFVTDWLNHRVQVFGPPPLPTRTTTWGGIKALYR